jgi:Ca2+-binding EF-hand superfamily protein
MKRFLYRILPAMVLACAAGWLFAAEPTKPVPALPVGEDDAQEFVFLGEARPLLVRLHVRVDGKPFTAAWDDFMKYLFAYLDVNGDGVLNKQEAERMPSPDQLSIGGLIIFAGGGAKVMMDSNKDGKVTLDELKAHCRIKHFTPFQFDFNLNPPDPLVRVGGLGGYRPEPEIAVVSKAVFDLLDGNKDGKLTKDELAAAQAVLLGRDENEDEIITTQELVPYSKPAGGIAAMAMQMGGNSATAGKQILVPIPVRGQAPPELAKLMQERYDPRTPPKKMEAPKAQPKPAPAAVDAVKATVQKAKADPKKGKKEEKKPEPERKLSRKQLGLDEATFARLDANKDGVLDSKEQAAFVQREPDLCLIVSFGSKSGVPLDIAAVAGRPALLADTVQLLQDNIALLDLGKTRMELRQHEKERKSNYFTDILRSQLSQLFRGADKDGNGYVDEKEAKASPQLRNAFKTLDRDGDGKVYEKEMLAYFDKMQEIQKRARAACVTLMLRDQSRGLFELLDSNRDGKLGLRELRQAPKLLERATALGKDHLTKDDMPRSYRLTLVRGTLADGLGAQEEVFERLYGFSSYEQGPAGRGPVWFRKMDRNRDGDVSPKEFLFGEALFRKLDADGDGLISLDEAEKAGDLSRR